MQNKKIIFVTIFIIILILLPCIAVCVFFYNCTDSLPDGISTIKLPDNNVVFAEIVQNSGVLLQGNVIVVTREMIQSSYPHLLRETDSISSGLIFQRKYIFYENNVFQRTLLGSIDIFDRYDKSEIHKLKNEKKAAFIFDHICGNNFQFSFSSQKNNQLTIMHQTESDSFELIDCNLSSRRQMISCDIVIYMGTYKKSNENKFTEKRFLFPLASTANLKLNKIIRNSHK
jgi:hypothetical protein